MENRNPKILQYSAVLFCSILTIYFAAAPKIDRKMSNLNIAFDRYTSFGTVMHSILVISVRHYHIMACAS